MTILESLRRRIPEMVEDLRAIVEAESPTSELGAVEACSRVVAGIGEKLLGSPPEVVRSGGRPHLRWRPGGDAAVLILGHFDTVWPLGTTNRLPFRVDGDFGHGPGIFDMKAGLVQGLYAAASLGDLASVEFFLNSDEETGSITSKELIEEAARRVSAVLVLEPSERGALKVARKGASAYTFDVTGLAAHSGLEPEKGINALSALARMVLRVEEMARPDLGTTVTPTVASAGTSRNVVPAAAQLMIDVRARTAAEQERVDSELRALRPEIDGAHAEISFAVTRSPFEAKVSKDLFMAASREADNIGIGPLEGVEVGGASDGNLTAAVGTPTLDGLGAVGEGAHADHERVLIPAMAERAALVAALIGELAGPRSTQRD